MRRLYTFLLILSIMFRLIINIYLFFILLFCRNLIDIFYIFCYNPGVNEEILTHLGLNPTQAKAYLAIVRHGSLTPPELAKNIGETRTNAYSVLDQLVELGLAT